MDGQGITGALRDAAEDTYSVDDRLVTDWVSVGLDRFAELCDEIDAVHANLVDDYEQVRRERDSALAQLDREQGEPRDGRMEYVRGVLDALVALLEDGGTMKSTTALLAETAEAL